jgi:hypothetical protein
MANSFFIRPYVTEQKSGALYRSIVRPDSNRIRWPVVAKGASVMDKPERTTDPNAAGATLLASGSRDAAVIDVDELQRARADETVLATLDAAKADGEFVRRSGKRR